MAAFDLVAVWLKNNGSYFTILLICFQIVLISILFCAFDNKLSNKVGGILKLSFKARYIPGAKFKRIVYTLF